MGKPVKQSGILNFTKSDMITVPRNLKTRSHAPETKLAYITSEEEDVLQKLKPGTPHKGPKGIPNYDSFGTTGETGQSGGDVDRQRGGGGQGGGSRQSQAAKNRRERKQKEYQKELEKKHDSGLPIVTTGKHDAEVRKIKAANKKRIKETQERLAKDRKKEGERKDKETISTQIMNRIMGGTPTGDDDAQTKKDWIDAGMVVPGEHKFRTEYNRLKAKYGDAWTKTGQAKDLLGYLAGVPAERGGGLGLRDTTYGGGPTGKIVSGMEDDRQWLLDQATSGKFWEWDKVTQDEFGKDLTEDQWFNFRQQLMASDPSYGNLDYKKALPYSSGYAPGKLMTPVKSAIEDLLGVGEKKYGPEYTGEPLDAALINALRERGGILDPYAREEGGQELAYDTGGGGITTLPVDETPGTTPGTTPGDQWTTAGAGKIGYMTPEGYQWGTMGDYMQYAKNGGIIGMDDGGYLDDYQAADSLMFRDPQEEEEWEYNV